MVFWSCEPFKRSYKSIVFVGGDDPILRLDGSVYLSTPLVAFGTVVGMGAGLAGALHFAGGKSCCTYSTGGSLYRKCVYHSLDRILLCAFSGIPAE